MRLLLALLVLVVAFGPEVSSAQDGGMISGVITSIDGRPLAGAPVRVVEVGMLTRTDATGRFAIVGVKPGKWLVIASFPGYQQRADSVVVIDKGVAQVALQLAHVEPARLRVWTAFQRSNTLRDVTPGPAMPSPVHE